jgi:hypothetical protein
MGRHGDDLLQILHATHDRLQDPRHMPDDPLQDIRAMSRRTQEPIFIHGHLPLAAAIHRGRLRTAMTIMADAASLDDPSVIDRIRMTLITPWVIEGMMTRRSSWSVAHAVSERCRKPLASWYPEQDRIDIISHRFRTHPESLTDWWMGPWSEDGSSGRFSVACALAFTGSAALMDQAIRHGFISIASMPMAQQVAIIQMVAACRQIVSRRHLWSILVTAWLHAFEQAWPITGDHMPEIRSAIMTGITDTRDPDVAAYLSTWLMSVGACTPSLTRHAMSLSLMPGMSASTRTRLIQIVMSQGGAHLIQTIAHLQRDGL